MCRISHLIWCGYVEGYMRFVSRQMINVLLNIFSTSTPDSHNPALTLFHKSLSQKWNGHAPNTNTQKLMMKTGKKMTKMFENSWNSLEHFFFVDEKMLSLWAHISWCKNLKLKKSQIERINCDVHPLIRELNYKLKMNHQQENSISTMTCKISGFPKWWFFCFNILNFPQFMMSNLIRSIICQKLKLIELNPSQLNMVSAFKINEWRLNEQAKCKFQAMLFSPLKLL